MNGKMKMLVALVLIVGVSAVMVYMIPAMAQQNGTLDQDRLRDRAQLRDRDCECLCLQNVNCTCQNENCVQNHYRNRIGGCIGNMKSMNMGEMQYQSQYRNCETHRMGQ